METNSCSEPTTSYTEREREREREREKERERESPFACSTSKTVKCTKIRKTYKVCHATLQLCTRHFYSYLQYISSELRLLNLPVINPLSPELNPICYLLALLGANNFLHVSRIRVKLLTFRLLMSYIYGAPILDVSRSHTTTQHSR